MEIMMTGVEDGEGRDDDEDDMKHGLMSNMEFN